MVGSNRRKILVVIVAVAVCLFVFGIGIGAYKFGQGQLFEVNYLKTEESYVLNLSSNITLATLRQNEFPHQLNYTELLVWESSKLNYTENRVFHSVPMAIINYGKGACGEFSILYVAACLANNISARLVATGYLIPNVVDHSWAEVNLDGQNWIPIEVTDSCVAIKNGENVNTLSTINNTSYYSARNYQLVFSLSKPPTKDKLFWWTELRFIQTVASA